MPGLDTVPVGLLQGRGRAGARPEQERGATRSGIGQHIDRGGRIEGGGECGGRNRAGMGLDGPEIQQGWVGVGAGKGRGVAAVKTVSRRAIPFVAVDGNTIRSEVGADQLRLGGR